MGQRPRRPRRPRLPAPSGGSPRPPSTPGTFRFRSVRVCLAYGVAMAARQPLLFKGDDLSQTDMTPARSCVGA